MNGFRNFGSQPPGAGWQNIGGGAWQHPGPLQWGGQNYPYGGMVITRTPPRPPVKPWSPPTPNQRQMDIARDIAMRRAMEQAQRQAEQARARERAVQEARERQREIDLARQREQQTRQAIERQRATDLARQREQRTRQVAERIQLQLKEQRRFQQQLGMQPQKQLQLVKQQEQWEQWRKRVQIKDKPIEPSLISPIDLIGGGLGARGARAGTSALNKILSGILAKRATRGIVTGPFGVVSRNILEKALSSSGPTIRVVTRLTQAPQIGRALSVATGESAEFLASAARGGGRLFRADIPQTLIMQLERIGLVIRSTTKMGGTTATELRFLPGASEFIAPLFR